MVNRVRPGEIGVLPPAVQISTGTGAHACALGVDRVVWCWGRNAYGQLGTGTTDISLVPIAVTERPAP